MPTPATYGASDPLTISGLSLNSGGVTGYGGEAIHKVAYVGNASGNSSYGSLSASLIAQAAMHLISYFPSYPYTDPTIIAGDGSLSATEAMYVSEEAVHMSVPQIPALPAGVTAITPVPGNDPTVSIAQNVQGLPGGTAVVPVSIAPANGVRAIDLVFTYDASRLQLSDGDVKLAGLAAKGWSLGVNVENGVVYVAASSPTALMGTSGTILDFNFHALVQAAAGAAKIGDQCAARRRFERGALPLSVVNGSVAVAAMQPALPVKAAAIDSVLAQPAYAAASAVAVTNPWLDLSENLPRPQSVASIDALMAAYPG